RATPDCRRVQRVVPGDAGRRGQRVLSRLSTSSAVSLDLSLARCLVLLGMGREQLKGHLDVLLLQVIADQPAHGYQLVCALRDRSGGTFDLPEGTVYPALHRLERQGLVVGEWDEQGPRRRRVYQVT